MKHSILTTISALLFLFISMSCEDADCISGEGIIETRNLNLDSFDAITLLGIDNITIIQGEEQEVKVTGYPNIINDLNTSISNKEWQVKLKNGCYRNSKLNIEITLPQLSAATLTGSGNITVNDFLNQDQQAFLINGSGNIDLGGNNGSTELSLSIIGSGNIHISKDFEDLELVNLNITGSGNLDAYAMKADHYNVMISGSGNANIFAVSSLSGTITGSGDINFKGNPLVDVTITGSGNVNDSN